MLQCSRGDSRIARKAKLGFVGHLERAAQDSLPRRGQTPLEKACAFAQGKDIGRLQSVDDSRIVRRGLHLIRLTFVRHLPPLGKAKMSTLRYG